MSVAGWTIRLARPDDAEAMAAIINDWIDETPWMPRIHSRETIRGFFSPELFAQREILLGVRGGEVLGYLSLKPEGFVSALYLAADARGLGLGAALMDEAKARHPAGLELGVFEPNDAARRFYSAQGFIDVPEARRTDTEEGVPELRMRWPGAAASGTRARI